MNQMIANKWQLSTLWDPDSYAGRVSLCRVGDSACQPVESNTIFFLLVTNKESIKS